MRRDGSLVADLVRSINRRFVNPKQLKTAGTPGSNTSIIVHRGRTTGQRYETPVAAAPIGDGFAIALVYGKNSDWVRNVLAAGEAELVHQGNTYSVHRPEVVAIAAVAKHFSAGERRAHRVFGVTRCLLLEARVPGR